MTIHDNSCVHHAASTPPKDRLLQVKYRQGILHQMGKRAHDHQMVIDPESKHFKPPIPRSNPICENQTVSHIAYINSEVPMGSNSQATRVAGIVSASANACGDRSVRVGVATGRGGGGKFFSLFFLISYCREQRKLSGLYISWVYILQCMYMLIRTFYHGQHPHSPPTSSTLLPSRQLPYPLRNPCHWSFAPNSHQPKEKTTKRPSTPTAWALVEDCCGTPVLRFFEQKQYEINSNMMSLKLIIC